MKIACWKKWNVIIPLICRPFYKIENETKKTVSWKQNISCNLFVYSSNIFFVYNIIIIKWFMWIWIIFRFWVIFNLIKYLHLKKKSQHTNVILHFLLNFLNEHSRLNVSKKNIASQAIHSISNSPYEFAGVVVDSFFFVLIFSLCWSLKYLTFSKRHV